MRARDKRHEFSLCLLADPPETAERVHEYFDSLQDFEVFVVPDGPLPEADWSVVPAQRLPDLEPNRNWLMQRTRIIAFGAPELLPPAFMFGCWDFLKDPWSPEELYLRVRRAVVDEGEDSSLSNEGLEFDPEMIWSARHAVDLRPAEFRLLEQLVWNDGEVVSREALTLTLATAVTSGSRALDMHISNLRRKLRVVCAPEPPPSIEVERGHGYRLTGWKGRRKPGVAR